MNIDDLLPPQSDRIHVNRYGTVIMNFETLVKITNGAEPALPLEEVRKALRMPVKVDMEITTRGEK